MTPEADLLREELRRAETRLRMLREANAALEARLLRPTALRKRVLATVVAALVTATLAYVVGAKLGDRRAAIYRELAESAHAQSVAEERTIVDACQVSYSRVTEALSRCTAERDAQRQRIREQHPTWPRGQFDCTCERGDPLCTCL